MANNQIQPYIFDPESDPEAEIEDEQQQQQRLQQQDVSMGCVGKDLNNTKGSFIQNAFLLTKTWDGQWNGWKT